MAQSPPDSPKNDPLALLIAKRDAAVKEAQRLTALVESVLSEVCQNALEAKPIASSVPPSRPEAPETPRAPHLIPEYDGPALEHGLFFGMGLSEAGTKALSILGDHDHPKTLPQLWAALKSTGYTIRSADPISVLSAALRKRAKRENDVVLLGNGEWGMTSWYSSDEIVKFLHNQNGKPGRNHALHSERTRQGMKQAAMERGVHVGRPRKITPEKAAEAERMLLSGATVTEVMAKLDASRWILNEFFFIRRKNNRITLRRKLDDSHYAAPRPAEEAETPSPGAQLRLVQ